MLERDHTVPRSLPRRSFLKLAGCGGLALGAYPYMATGQTSATGAAAPALKPKQLRSAFVQIASNGEVTVAINRLEFGQGVNTAVMPRAPQGTARWPRTRRPINFGLFAPIHSPYEAPATPRQAFNAATMENPHVL